MLDSDHLAFILTGVSISLASVAAGADPRPSMSRGLGCKVLDGGQRLAVFIRRSQSAELIANVGSSGRVANVFSLPSNNRTLQLKGCDARVLPFAASDLAIVERHVADLLREVVPLGLSEAVVCALFDHPADDLVSVVYTPSAAFSQTPGPKAGVSLPGPA